MRSGYSRLCLYSRAAAGFHQPFIECGYWRPTCPPIDIEGFFYESIQAEFPLCFPSSLSSHGYSQMRIFNKLFDPGNQNPFVVARNNETSSAFFNQARDIAAINCYDRESTGHSLHDGIRATFTLRSMNQ